MCSIYLISPSIINKTSYIPFFELKNYSTLMLLVVGPPEAYHSFLRSIDEMRVIVMHMIYIMEKSVRDSRVPTLLLAILCG